METALINHKPKLYTIAESARKLGYTYHKLKYAIASRWIELYQTDPDLITEDELARFAAEKELELID